MAGKLILLENDGNVYVREAYNGRDVSFSSVAEFERITDEVLPSSEYYLYEPPNYHVVGRDGHNNPALDSTQAERIVSMIPAYKINLQNPLYGLTGQELIDKQAELDAQAAYAAKVAEITAEQDAAGVKEYTPQQVKDYIDAQVAGASTAEEKFQVVVSLIKKLAVFVLRPEPPNVD